MQTLVIYDIENDNIRNKMAEICKDYGLERIQYSAFLGELNHNKREELFLKLRKNLQRKKGNIQLFPICEKDLHLRKIYIIEEEGNKKCLTDKINSPKNKQ